MQVLLLNDPLLEITAIKLTKQKIAKLEVCFVFNALFFL